MSDAEDDFSDVEVDDDFDDFDPLAGDEDEDGDEAAGSDAGSDDEEDADEANADGEDGDVAEEAADGDVAVAAVGEAAPPGRARARRDKKARARVSPADRQAAQAVDTRKIVVVPDEERQTSNRMTTAEVARAIALRAEQITRYPSAYTDVGGLTHAKDIARKELYDHRSPLVLRRRVGWTAAGERIIEKWKVREMSYPPLN